MATAFLLFATGLIIFIFTFTPLLLVFLYQHHPLFLALLLRVQISNHSKQLFIPLSVIVGVVAVVLCLLGHIKPSVREQDMILCSRWHSVPSPIVPLHVGHLRLVCKSPLLTVRLADLEVSICRAFSCLITYST